MKREKAIAIFDIGKTNKKVLLFDENFRVVYQHEMKFETTMDEDGFECDDIEKIEIWLKSCLEDLISNHEYEIVATNFCTYGASLAFVDENGKRLTPLYNYLKEIPGEIQESLFNRYGGEINFCRATASPKLDLLLNSGIQLLWMQKTHPVVFRKVKGILHFPQYLSFLFSGEIAAEATSVGCHTFMWDFDKNQYHQWLHESGISLPGLKPSSSSISVKIAGEELQAGIGIHDSSASLAPYLIGSEKKFLLISTGTWCVSMNPFNNNPLSEEELKNNCLAYLSIDKQPVKSSMFFLGHIHDVNLNMLTKFYNVTNVEAKSIKADESILRRIFSSKDSEAQFFENEISERDNQNQTNLQKFDNFSEAYHSLVYDLVKKNSELIRLILGPDDEIDNIYITGGFARNDIFNRLVATIFSSKSVYTSQVNNASALGAALVLWHVFGENKKPEINFNLKKWDPIKL